MRDARLAQDLHHADVAGAANVGAAAELDRLATDRHHAHLLAVLLTEHRDSALLLRLLERQHLDDRVAIRANLCVDETLDLPDLFRCHRREVREVEAQPIGCDQRALLTNVIAGRISNRFDLRGSNFTVDAACASSLAALHIAAGQLRSGDCDAALVGAAAMATDASDRLAGSLFAYDAEVPGLESFRAKL